MRESSLPDDAKNHLLEFIRRFPSLLFYREDDVFLDERERERSITFPAWLRPIRTTLAFVEPGSRAEVRYDGCDLNEDLIYDLAYSWFSFGLIGPLDLETPGIRDEALLLYAISENQAATATLAGVHFLLALLRAADGRFLSDPLVNGRFAALDDGRSYTVAHLVAAPSLLDRHVRRLFRDAMHRIVRGKQRRAG